MPDTGAQLGHGRDAMCSGLEKTTALAAGNLNAKAVPRRGPRTADVCERLIKTETVLKGSQSHGRTWDRTRDLPRVKRALSR